MGLKWVYVYLYDLEASFLIYVLPRQFNNNSIIFVQT